MALMREVEEADNSIDLPSSRLFMHAEKRQTSDKVAQVVFVCAPKRETNKRQSREETTCPACMDSNLICILLVGKYC